MDEKEFSRLFALQEERLLGLGKDILTCLRGKKGAIIEIAGRDSIAAVLSFCGSLQGVEVLVPTVVYTGTEFGSPHVLLENISFLRDKLKGHAQLLPPVVMGSPGWWSAVNGRYLSVLIQLYGHTFTCVGCHMYLHAARIPLARELGIDMVISGERESHGGKIKINQCPLALDAYSKLMEEFGVRLLLPLRKKNEEAEISSLTGDWKENQRQRSCVLSGNYRDLDGACSVEGNGDIFKRYLQEYLLPVTYEIVESLLHEGSSDYIRITENILRKITEARGER